MIIFFLCFHNIIIHFNDANEKLNVSELFRFQIHNAHLSKNFITEKNITSIYISNNIHVFDSNENQQLLVVIKKIYRSFIY